jgi:uncharacterized protein YggE
MEVEMRNKLVVLLISGLLVLALSACGPIATAVKGSSVISSSNIQGGSPSNLAGPAQATVTTQQVVTPPPGIRSLTVTGEGRATLAPDMAYVNIGVHTENKDVGEALASNKAQAQKVADAIKAMGVDAKDIQTTNFNIYPSQTYGPNGQVTDTKYVVENTVYVTLRDLNKLGDLLDAAVKAGANNIYNVQFDVADKTAALSDARKSAVQNAYGQASELASAANVKLGAVQSITVNSASVPIPVYQGMGMGGGGVAAPAASVPVSPGQMILTVYVSIVYEIQ